MIKGVQISQWAKQYFGTQEKILPDRIWSTGKGNHQKSRKQPEKSEYGRL